MQRLSDKIIAAHEQACAQGKAEVARHLLQALEMELSAFGGDSQEVRDVDAAVAAAFQRQQALSTAS
jgi:2-succinyl-5-enolpyruvyl-6-hydroxy-3-cyclohexene-1-carboxylate synthase